MMSASTVPHFHIVLFGSMNRHASSVRTEARFHDAAEGKVW